MGKQNKNKEQEIFWTAMNRRLGLHYTQMNKQDRDYWENNPIKYLMVEVNESLNVLEAYLDQDENCEIIMDGMKVGQEIPGPPRYEHVLTTVEVTDEYFKHLGAMTPTYFSKENFEKLFYYYDNLRLKCDRFHDERKDSKELKNENRN